MGWQIVVGPCFGCGRIFGYSADRVPSIVVDGTREPICGDCVARVNPVREANGLDPIVVLPGAYDGDEVP